jgi:hypothetical protein
MGNNTHYQSGNENNDELKSIIKIDYFENKNLKIKKIACGIDFHLFLTRNHFNLIKLKNF